MKEIHAHKIKKGSRPDFLFNPFLPPIPGPCCSKTTRRGWGCCGKQHRFVVALCSAACSSTPDLPWICTAEVKCRGLSPWFPPAAPSREDVSIILLKPLFLRQPESFCQEASFPFNQQMCQYLNVLRAQLLITFLLAGFAKAILSEQRPLLAAVSWTAHTQLGS